jgi:hypothetical protein
MKVVRWIAMVSLVALALFGCSETKRVTRPGTTAPTPNSPVTAVRLFEWGWNHLDTRSLATLLSNDFQFHFAPQDSAGTPTTPAPLSREELLCTTNEIFLGGGTQPPATSITLAFDPTLTPLSDNRPGKDPRWHKEILTSVDMRLVVDGGHEYRLSGYARFYLVRGDSARIPPDLGVPPDSARWYMDRWNDETLETSTALLRPLPVGNTTWGQILQLYPCAAIPARAR